MGKEFKSLMEKHRINEKDYDLVAAGIESIPETEKPGEVASGDILSIKIKGPRKVGIVCGWGRKYYYEAPPEPEKEPEPKKIDAKQDKSNKKDSKPKK